MSGVLFELELFGGGVEKRYRRMRPEVEAMPWGTIDTRGISEEDLVAARRAWTGAAFQEHRTGIACAATLRALIECRAPLDLIALGSRFPLDEMVHVELCARMAMELGGGTEIQHDPDLMVLDAKEGTPPLLRAAELVVRFFCVGEALSIPLLRGTWHAAKHPLPKAVLGRIVKDEAAHGTFGFAFLDWAAPMLGEDDLAHLARHARLAVDAIHDQWKDIEKRPRRTETAGDALAWMESGAYLQLARKSMETKVLAPLRERGIDPMAVRP
ncbi:MAG: hypothetical protein JNM74_27360 [Myxococcales bacterium]|nr:hypothetical protein [Myxococcales bacterium]